MLHELAFPSGRCIRHSHVWIFHTTLGKGPHKNNNPLPCAASSPDHAQVNFNVNLTKKRLNSDPRIQHTSYSEPRDRIALESMYRTNPTKRNREPDKTTFVSNCKTKKRHVRRPRKPVTGNLFIFNGARKGLSNSALR